jgi:hypothetical protein
MEEQIMRILISAIKGLHRLTHLFLMKQESGWKRTTLLGKTSFKKRLKILAGYTGNPEVIGSSF